MAPRLIFTHCATDAFQNSKVCKCVQPMAVLCYCTEQDDIDHCSTSFKCIDRNLEKYYNIGVNFL